MPVIQSVTLVWYKGARGPLAWPIEEAGGFSPPGAGFRLPADGEAVL